jgi:hypothetical protein
MDGKLERKEAVVGYFKVEVYVSVWTDENHERFQLRWPIRDLSNKIRETRLEEYLVKIAS